MNEYLASTYSADSSSPLEHMERRKAAEWAYDPEMERIAVIRKETSDLYDRMGAALHMSMGYYENAKELAERAGRDVTNPEKGGK